jgi:hypothetical protein
VLGVPGSRSLKEPIEVTELLLLVAGDERVLYRDRTAPYVLIP